MSVKFAFYTETKTDLTQTWDFTSGSVFVATPVSASQAAPRSYVLSSISESLGSGVEGLSIIGSAINTTSTVDVVVGGGRFVPSDYAIPGRTSQLSFEAIGQVVLGVTGTLTLYNVTDDASAGTLTWTETTGSYKSYSITPVPSGSKIYEVRAKKTGGSLSDYVLFYGVNLRVSWS
jgi:hypothetical protein